MAKKIFECIQCGNCCKSFDIVPTDEDVERWVTERRDDITDWVSDAGDVRLHDYIFLANPKTGFCPFLSFNGSVYECFIHGTKPEMCQKWPLNKGDDVAIRECMEYIDCHGKFALCAELGKKRGVIRF